MEWNENHHKNICFFDVVCRRTTLKDELSLEKPCQELVINLDSSKNLLTLFARYNSVG